jgi:phospholipase C
MTEPNAISRRQLLVKGGAAAAGLAAAGAYSSLPAWARPVASMASGLRAPGSRPFPHLPAGHPTPGLEKIEHVVVLMMENHSFDNVLGMVPHEVKGRAKVDGLTVKGGRAQNSNPSSIAPYGIEGPDVMAQLAASPCQGSSVSQSWNASHTAWNNGANNGFVQSSGTQAMWYWDRSFLPTTYSLAQYFPIGERYFCSVLAQTYPNRRFLFCGTSSGITATNGYTFDVPAANGTIFNQLLEHKISWLNYVTPSAGGALEGSPLIVPEFAQSLQCTERMVPISDFYSAAARGTLPAFSFLDPNYSVDSEENPQDIQAGERFVAQVVNALIHSRLWHKTALFITYDEHGGYYDHVPPPAAIAPDSIAPITTPVSLTDPSEPLMPGGFNRYGFRVPLFVISPWARANYASRVVQDHTSILAFIERKWNLPALTFRDANAHPMTDYFDFKRPTFAKAPKLAAAPAMAPGLAECQRAGLTPPAGTPGL